MALLWSFFVYRMKKYFVLSLLTPLFVFAQTSDLINKVEKSVLYIKTYDSNMNEYASGSGFVMFKNNIGVSNYHVLENASFFKCYDNKYNEYQGGKILFVDKENDLVVFEIDNGVFNNLYASTTPVKTGDKVFSIGNPKGLTFSYTEGAISSIRSNDSQELIQYTMPISSGSSGSPIFNKKGGVVGVVVSQLKDGQNLNFGIPIKHLLNLTKKDTINLTLSEFTANEIDYWKIGINMHYDMEMRFRIDNSIIELETALSIFPNKSIIPVFLTEGYIYNGEFSKAIKMGEYYLDKFQNDYNKETIIKGMIGVAYYWGKFCQNSDCKGFEYLNEFVSNSYYAEAPKLTESYLGNKSLWGVGNYLLAKTHLIDGYYSDDCFFKAYSSITYIDNALKSDEFCELYYIKALAYDCMNHSISIYDIRFNENKTKACENYKKSYEIGVKSKRCIDSFTQHTKYCN